MFFIDDGFSGTNFDRPDWNRLEDLIKENKISTIIVKDMSRLGRNYLQVGMYTEMLFPNNNIRFIAINNGIDSNNQETNDMAPFINIFNEFYAKDTSRKITAVFKAKGESGKRLNAIPPYGYLKSPNDKDEGIVDEIAAPVVKKIFNLCINGYGPSQIANKLTDENIPTPSMHFKNLEINHPTNPAKKWNPRSVADILDKQEYVGDTVNFKTKKL